MHLQNLLHHLLTAALIFLQIDVSYAATLDKYLPEEILTLKLPENQAKMWKSLNRYVVNGELELLNIYLLLKPLQIGLILSVSNTLLRQKTLFSLDEFIDRIKQSTIQLIQIAKLLECYSEKTK